MVRRQRYGAGTAKDVPGISWLTLATPYKTEITGIEHTYGNKGANNVSSTGFGDPTKKGIVVVRAPKDAKQPWEPAPELPGLGGWATITSVSGSPKRYAYNDGPGGTDWVAFEWTDTSGRTR